MEWTFCLQVVGLCLGGRIGVPPLGKSPRRDRGEAGSGKEGRLAGRGRALRGLHEAGGRIRIRQVEVGVAALEVADDPADIDQRGGNDPQGQRRHGHLVVLRKSGEPEDRLVRPSEIGRPPEVERDRVPERAGRHGGKKCHAGRQGTVENAQDILGSRGGFAGHHLELHRNPDSALHDSSRGQGEGQRRRRFGRKVDVKIGAGGPLAIIHRDLDGMDAGSGLGRNAQHAGGRIDCGIGRGQVSKGAFRRSGEAVADAVAIRVHHGKLEGEGRAGGAVEDVATWKSFHHQPRRTAEAAGGDSPPG
jgi:hypothetical protein